MVFLRSNFEAELVDRCGVLLTFVGKDGVTVSGANLSLNGPLRTAIGSLGLYPAAFVVADSDLVAITGALSSQVYDIGELVTLQNCMNAFMLVDRQIDKDSLKNDQIRQGMVQRIKDAAAYCLRVYGYGAATLSEGSIDLGIASTDCDNGSAFVGEGYPWD